MIRILIVFLIGQNVPEVYAKKYMLGKKNVRTVRMGKRIPLLDNRRCFTSSVKSNQGGFVYSRQTD